MTDYKYCELKKTATKLFDMHWLGAEDCPLTCPEGTKTQPDQKEE